MSLRKSFAAIVRSVERAAPGIVLDATRDVARAISDNAPKESGKLAASTKAVPGNDSPGVATAFVRVTGGHEPEEIVGHVEFGRHGQTSDPFIRRSFLQKRDSAASKIARGVAREIHS